MRSKLRAMAHYLVGFRYFLRPDSLAHFRVFTYRKELEPSSCRSLLASLQSRSLELSLRATEYGHAFHENL